MSTVKYYIAGPMSGVPQYNYPLFDSAAAALRARGYSVMSPAELDDADTRAKALNSADGRDNTGHTWGQFLARDVRIVADDVGGVVLLPGWTTSRGAKLEAYVGLLCGHEFYGYTSDGQMFPLSHEQVKEGLR